MPAVKETVKQVDEIGVDKYKFGWSTDLETETAPIGLTEETIKFITANLEKNRFTVNYVSFLTTELEKLKLNTSERKILLSSVKLGQTRLIDNIEFN